MNKHHLRLVTASAFAVLAGIICVSQCLATQGYLVSLSSFSQSQYPQRGKVLDAATPVRVQFKSASTKGGKTLTVAMPGSTTSGNELIVAVTNYYNGANAGTPWTISDNYHNAWHTAINYVNSATVAVYYAENISGGANHQITVATSVGTYYLVTAVEYSGLLSSGSLDASNGNRVTGANYASSAVLTTQAGDLLFGVHHVWNPTAIFTPASPWATVQTVSDGTYQQQQVQDQVANATGSYQSKGALSASLDTQSVIIAFKPGGAIPPDTTVPSVPANLSATSTSSSQINLSWTASTDNVAVAGYQIFRGGSQIATTTLPVYSDIGLAASTGYSYTVTAFDAAGNISSQSASASAATQAQAADTTAPTTPTNLSAAAVSSNQINLSWTASTDNVAVAGYEVFRNGSQIAAPISSSYSDSSALPSTAYSYTVLAVDTSDNLSPQSAAIQVSTPAFGQTSVAWAKPANTSGAPNDNGWFTLPYDPVSGQTIVYATAGSGIYSSDIFFYNSAANTWTKPANLGTGSLIDACPADTISQPGDRHPIGQMAVDTKRDVMWLYSGVDAGCGGATVTTNGTAVTWVNGGNDNWTFPTGGQINGQTVFIGGSYYSIDSVQDSQHLTLKTSAGVHNSPVQLNVTSGTETNPRNDMYYLQLTPNPANDTWHQVAITKLPAGGAFASAVYDPDDDIIFSFGYDIGAGSNDNWVYCSTIGNPTAGVLTAKQSAAGCAAPDDWTEVDIGGTHPAGDSFPGLVYDTVTKKVIMFGGNNHNQTWIYDVPSKLWTQKALSTAAPINTTYPSWGMPDLAYDSATNKVLYHQTGGAGAPADWQYDPVADTWTQLSSSTGGESGAYEVMAYDAGQNALIGFGGGIWKGQLSSGGDTIAPSVPANLTATAISSSAVNLSWTASTDNVGVAGYKIYRGGAQIGTSAANSFSDTNLSASTNYSYTVTAFDAAGNISAQSTGASATTLTVVVSNQPPVVNAGSNQTITLPTSSVNLSGSATDDGLPNPPGSLTYSWTQVSGPVSATIDSPSSAASEVDGLTTAGSYVFQLTASDSQLASSANVTITVNPAPDTTAPQVTLNALDSNNQPVSQSETVSGNITFNVSASDPAVSGQVSSELQSISLKQNGVTVSSSNTGSLSYSIATGAFTDTVNTFLAVAVDEAGNSASSQTISLMANNFLVNLP